MRYEQFLRVAEATYLLGANRPQSPYCHYYLLLITYNGAEQVRCCAYLPLSLATSGWSIQSDANTPVEVVS